jgi:ABC-2 type transport system permease protein
MKAPDLKPIDSARFLKPSRGRRLGSAGSLLASLGALYGLTLRQHLHGKRWWVVGALFLLPALLAGLVRVTVPKEKPAMIEFAFVFMFIPQALLPLVALLYGSGIVKDEQEEQTFTYLLIRPIPRWAIYLVKVLATLTTTVVLTTVFTLLTYATIYVGADADGENIPLRCFKAICIHGLAAATYCCLFGLMSLLTKWTLVLGILYTAFFEGFLANMPFSVRLLTVLYYSRLIAYRSMSFLVRGPQGNKEDVAAEAWQLDVKADPSLLEHPALGTCLIVLLGASLVCMLWGAYLCSRREFHVKTPEGG